MIFLNVNKLNKCYSSINRNNQRIVQRFRGTISGKDVSPGDNAGSKNDDNSTKSSTAKEPEIIKRKNSRTQPLKMVDSLDGTSVVADFENQKANSRKKYFSAAHVKGMGGNFIRAPWEQDLVTPEVSTPSNSTSAPSSNPNSMMHLNKFLKSPKTVSILGVPMSFGQTLAGTDLGPELIREAGLSTALKRLGWRISNDTNLQVEVPTSKDSEADALFCQKTGALAHNASSVGRVNQALQIAVEKIVKNNEFALTIGGDHSIGLGSLAGILSVRPETGVIWVDAHADLNTPFTSETGNMHGMPIGLLMAEDSVRCSIPGFSWLKGGPRLKPNKLVYIGCRDLDQAERREIRSKNILCFTMHDVDRWGIGEIVNRAINHLGPDVPLHLSYDIDAVDPEVAPSTGTVVRGGFNYREAHFICEALAETNQLCSMDLVEINPSLTRGASAQPTIQLGMALVASAMGQRIL